MPIPTDGLPGRPVSPDMTDDTGRPAWLAASGPDPVPAAYPSGDGWPWADRGDGSRPFDSFAGADVAAAPGPWFGDPSAPAGLPDASEPFSPDPGGDVPASPFALDGMAPQGTAAPARPQPQAPAPAPAPDIALPPLAEKVPLPTGVINGMFADDVLIGNGTSTYLVSLIDALSQAANDNSLGVYEVDAAGNIVDVRLLVKDANATPDAQAGVFGVEDGHQLGFFLVSDGADWAKSLADDDELSFIDSNGGGASLSDGSDISLAVNGTDAGQLVFHSLSRTLNPDGVTHVVSGSFADGARILIAFEDLNGGGDRDYQDLVIQVDDALLI